MEELEEWRDVPEFEGKYQVSSLGRVRSLTREVRSHRGTRTVKGQLLTPSPRADGYLVVNLGRGNQRRVHHLVMYTFIGERPPGMDICHADCNKTNNRLKNLRYDDRSGNMQDTARAGRTNRGTRNPRAVLTPEIVTEARRRWVPYRVTVKELAAEFGVSEIALGLAVRKTDSGNWKWLDEAS